MVSVGSKSFLFCHMFTMQQQRLGTGLKEVSCRIVLSILAKWLTAAGMCQYKSHFSFIYFYLAGKLKNIGCNTLVQCI